MAKPVHLTFSGICGGGNLVCAAFRDEATRKTYYVRINCLDSQEKVLAAISRKKVPEGTTVILSEKEYEKAVCEGIRLDWYRPPSRRKLAPS